MANPMMVHHELSEAIRFLDWAAIYSRTANLDQIDPENAAAFRRKLDAVTSLVQDIEAKLPKPKEVSRAEAA